MSYLPFKLNYYILSVAFIEEELVWIEI
jgi:hypothetical protein